MCGESRQSTQHKVCVESSRDSLLNTRCVASWVETVYSTQGVWRVETVYSTQGVCRVESRQSTQHKVCGELGRNSLLNTRCVASWVETVYSTQGVWRVESKQSTQHKVCGESRQSTQHKVCRVESRQSTQHKVCGELGRNSLLNTRCVASWVETVYSTQDVWRVG